VLQVASQKVVHNIFLMTSFFSRQIIIIHIYFSDNKYLLLVLSEEIIFNMLRVGGSSPLIILSKSVERESGRDVQLQNINSAKVRTIRDFTTFISLDGF
jgi:hypothetical protein